MLFLTVSSSRRDTEIASRAHCLCAAVSLSKVRLHTGSRPTSHLKPLHPHNRLRLPVSSSLLSALFVALLSFESYLFAFCWSVAFFFFWVRPVSCLAWVCHREKFLFLKMRLSVCQCYFSKETSKSSQRLPG